MISQKDIAAWRDSELETRMPTDGYCIFVTSPMLLYSKSITQQLSRIIAFLSRTHRGSFAETQLYMLKPFYIKPTQGPPCVDPHTYIHTYIHMYV